MKPNANDPFGIPRPVLALFMVSLVTCAAIVLFQLSERNDGTGQSFTIFYYLFLVLDYPTALLGAALLFLALNSQVQQAGAAITEVLMRHPQVSILGLFAVLGFGAVFVYHAYPLCMDEYAAVFQGEVFASGAVVGSFPAELVDWLLPRGFQGVFLATSSESGATASMYLPGHALLLAPFAAVGVPWLANPLIGALSVLAIARLAERLYDSVEAGWFAGFLALASPALTLNAISYYSMSAHLLCNVAFLLCLLGYTRRSFLIAGLLGSLALNLHNPVPHALFALPFIGWLTTQRSRWSLLPWLFAGYVPGLVLMVAWRYLIASISGHAGTAGLSIGGALADITQTLWRVMSSPGEAIVTARLIGLMKIWIWAVPALIPAALYGFWLRRADIHVRLLAASALVTLVGYLFVPFDQGHGWGFRYFHPVWFALPVLAAGLVAPRRVGAEDTRRSQAIVAYLKGTATMSGTLLTGLMAWQMHGFISEHLAQLPEAQRGQPRVLMIDPTWGYYAVDLVQNDPFLRDPVVTMITHGTEADAEMLAKHFPSLVKLGGDYRGTVYGTLSAPAHSDRSSNPAPAP